MENHASLINTSVNVNGCFYLKHHGIIGTRKVYIHATNPGLLNHTWHVGLHPSTNNPSSGLQEKCLQKPLSQCWKHTPISSLMGQF